MRVNGPEFDQAEGKMHFTIEHTLQRAEEAVDTFKAFIKDVPYEAKGMIFSEMFFIFATMAGYLPRQILESGRARAQSTYLLGRCFPECRIISIEHRADSPDVAIAEKRLKSLPNVSPLFGDARVALPALMLPGDAVLIDGPKRFRALRLTLELIKTGKPACVFIHDCYQGSVERHFLELHIPEAHYSDHPGFVEQYSFLDQLCWETIQNEGVDSWQPHFFGAARQKSYGPTLACLPGRLSRSASSLLRHLKFMEIKDLMHLQPKAHPSLGPE